MRPVHELVRDLRRFQPDAVVGFEARVDAVKLRDLLDDAADTIVRYSGLVEKKL